MFSNTASFRTGLGTDLHRLAPNLPLWIGGIHLTESPLGCVAHSDGDALLHALIDALLGCVAMGDIGTHFPPSDKQWKNASSINLLQQTLVIIRNIYPAFSIINVDAVVHLEAPKLGQYRGAIVESIATALTISPTCVSLKAKTGEGLPPIGTHEAISTQVIVLCSLH
jgi:2-C-methyl-D-erythritol 2,4-cyclodiphosphate synthase